MNMDCFLKRYTDYLMNDKDDGIFENLKLLTGGTTSARIGKLLNFAVSQMSDTEYYVEVGVFTGSTLCSASYVNNKLCVGIDNYLPNHMAEMTGWTPAMVRDRCLANIRAIDNGMGRVRLIEKDFKDVKPEEIGGPVAVSFIDGKHDYPSVIENLKWLEPMLTDHAVIVFDDVNFVEVSLAIEEWMGQRGANYDLLAYVKPYFGDNGYMCSIRDRFLNNGVCVIRYHRDSISNTFSYDLKKVGFTKDQMKGDITC